MTFTFPRSMIFQHFFRSRNVVSGNHWSHHIPYHTELTGLMAWWDDLLKGQLRWQFGNNPHGFGVLSFRKLYIHWTSSWYMRLCPQQLETWVKESKDKSWIGPSHSHSQWPTCGICLFHPCILIHHWFGGPGSHERNIYTGGWVSFPLECN